MFNRPLHQQPYSVPKGVSLDHVPKLPLENVYHTPGQNAAICFFDPNSQEDLAAMREILKGKEVKKWMDDATQVTKSEYREWAGTEDTTSFLFAVLDARTSDPVQMKTVRGFIYIYSEREEKFRVKRIERQGFLPPATKPRYALEVSFAARPLTDGMQQGSGLMSSSLRQACLQVQMLLDPTDDREVVIFAFVDQQNLAAQRTLEASGFVKRGLMKYDWDSEGETCLYVLNWRILQKKIRQKLVEVLQKQEPTTQPSDQV
ncbi:MAG: Peptidase protein [Patescibacteria group bacterium]|nr:Peptidase protein [Patescibacteria group bacterium]